MILITGATGNFGKSAIDFLLKKNFPAGQISALVRDPAKAADLSAKGVSLKTGDYNDYDSLVKAFQGVEKLLLVSSSDLNDRSQQHLNAIKAAREASVKHIVYTSFQRKNEVSSPVQMISQGHLDAEKAILESGTSYTILQNGLYADILPWFMGEKVFETGIFLPGGTDKAAFTVRNDMAEAAANILIEDSHQNKIYLTATNETNSFADVARILSSISGKNVDYTDAPYGLFIEALTGAGVPEGIIGMIAGFSQAIKEGEFNFADNDLENLLHRKPTTLKDFLTAVYFPAS